MTDNTRKKWNEIETFCDVNKTTGRIWIDLKDGGIIDAFKTSTKSILRERPKELTT